MRCLLAAFDQAHRSADGSHWTWHHRNLDSEVLDAFYYDCAAKHWPVADESVGDADSLQGGCARVGEKWSAWYRFVDGGRDKAGRRGRYVLLAAFVDAESHSDRDWSGVLLSAEFERLAEQAKSACPVPPPDDLEMEWDPPMVAGLSDSAAHLRHQGHHFLQPESAFQVIAEACSALPHGQAFDCSFVKEHEVARVRFAKHERNVSQSNVAATHRSATTSNCSSERSSRWDSFINGLQQAILDWDKWTRSRTSRLLAVLVAAFVLGAALGLVIGWQLERTIQELSERQP